MREASAIKTQVHEELNATRTRFHTIAADFVGNTLMRQVNTYRSTFTTKGATHRVCGQKQQTDHDASVMCSKFLTAAKPNRTVLCTSEPLGMWLLEDMVETFGRRYTAVDEREP